MNFENDKGITLFKLIVLVLIVIIIAAISYYVVNKEIITNSTPSGGSSMIRHDPIEKDKTEKEVLEYPAIVKEKKDIASFIKTTKEDGWVYDNTIGYNDGNSYFDGLSLKDASNIKAFTSSASDASGAAASSGGLFSFGSKNFSQSISADESISDEYLGFSVGGAKDATSYRENIKNNYFPLETDITYEGIYYDYYFDTGKTNSANDGEMFYPSYSKAISKDPISGEEEYFLSVGLNSNIKESDFSRENLNLILALDISGSMGTSLNSYYYDGNSKSNNSEDVNKTKMQLAEEALNMTLDVLGEYDNVGIVLFESEAYRAKNMDLMVNTDVDSLKKHILEVKATGGTNFGSAYKLATEMIKENELFNVEGFTNRIIVITDAMPNIGNTTKEGLKKEMYENAQKGIYTSFIGVGVDFNTEVIKNITDVRGSNYHSIAEVDDFKKVLADEFDFMVTPMVYDLDLSLLSEDYEIEAVYGTDSIDSEEANIMHVNTLFPSSSDSSGDVKGGLIVLQLKKIKDTKDAKMDIVVSYETVKGEKKQNSTSVTFENNGKEYYDNTGIRKGIALERYVSTIKDWIAYDRDEEKDYLITEKCGIICWPVPYLNENERQSVKLEVSKEYKEIFKKLSDYLETEMKAVDDNTMQQEIDILKKLSK